MSSEVFRALADRAEAGGDARLSDDIWRALGWKYLRDDLRFPPEWTSPDGTKYLTWRPNLQTSIDAHSALPGKVIDLWQVTERDGDIAETWQAKAFPVGGDWIDDSAMCDAAPTEPLARLAALLRAMAATPSDPAAIKEGE